MTALQDWLSLRPVDQNAIRHLVCRPFRAVLNVADPRDDRTRFKTMCAGRERC